jgi:hypothetical protein
MKPSTYISMAAMSTDKCVIRNMSAATIAAMLAVILLHRISIRRGGRRKGVGNPTPHSGVDGFVPEHLGDFTCCRVGIRMNEPQMGADN